jgi:hypothetical protein
MYLWRAVDHEGEVLDVLVQRRRDSRAALRLMRRLLRKQDKTDTGFNVICRVAIQELCSRYCQTIDAQDSDRWARCFLPDGAFEFDGRTVRGYAALREYAEAHTRVLRGRHKTLNHLYDVDGDRACDDGRLDCDTLRLQDHGTGRAGEDRRRHGKAERLRGVEIDYQLEFRRLLDG